MTSGVSGVQRVPNGSEYQNPQISAQQDLGGPGNLHFWPEILSREPEEARIPRGPTGQGGSEGWVWGQRSPDSKSLCLGPGSLQPGDGTEEVRGPRAGPAGSSATQRPD